MRKIVVCAEAIKTMEQLPDACVDAVVTDPPYGLEFMGKEWDKFWDKRDHRDQDNEGIALYLRAGKNLSGYKAGMTYQSWTTSWATEAYRILKPGAYMLVMGGTRTHHRLGVGLEDAGFQILDELTWIYASGFPKNYDVSKGIDKRAGAEREVVGILPPSYPGNMRREFQAGVGKRPNGEPWGNEGMPRRITSPATPEAKYWEGYGTALKPAHEPIWLCKKPNEGSYVDNILRHGCGAMNIDGSRVEYLSENDKESAKPGGRATSKPLGNIATPDSGRNLPRGQFQAQQPPGRWPANVIVDCNPEEFQGGAVIEGFPKLREFESRTKPGIFCVGQHPDQGKVFKTGEKETDYGNGLLGPYTRFFVIPKPSKAEKDKGCEDFYYEKVKDGHIRCSYERWEELGKEEERIKEETGKHVSLRARGNIHVTVKPVRLGKWLIKLITPHQHPIVLLDPFCGSGSFLVAAQELNFEESYQIKFYGIDKDKDSVETAKARLNVSGQS